MINLLNLSSIIKPACVHTVYYGDMYVFTNMLPLSTEKDSVLNNSRDSLTRFEDNLWRG
jgi:hypothetical protein